MTPAPKLVRRPIPDTPLIEHHLRFWQIVRASSAHQRRHFRAVPLGFAHLAGDLTALAVDQQCRRHARNGEAA
jgi:hypothetical protein